MREGGIFPDLLFVGSELLILFKNLFKPRQLRLAVYVLLTWSVLSTTSIRCFEQPAARFLVCFLIFIEYKMPDDWFFTIQIFLNQSFIFKIH